MRIDSHNHFKHDTIEALGFDWSQAAQRGIDPVVPKHVYFPTNLEEVEDAVIDANRRCAAMFVRDEVQRQFKIRGTGHSDNNLVLPRNGEPVISTARINGKDWVEGKNDQIVVMAGEEIGKVAKWLDDQNCSLPVRPDHDHISVGGLVSVGGVSASAHKYGLFVDNVVSIVFVYREDGSHATLTRRNSDFKKALCGTGNLGLIVSVTIKVLRFSKRRRLLRAVVRPPITRAGRFGKHMRELAQNEINGFEHVRGIWVASMDTQLGLLTKYKTVKNADDEQWHARNALVERLEAIGEIAGTLDRDVADLEIALKRLGFSAIVKTMIEAIQQPVYFSDYDVETLTDRVLDSSVGAPACMLASFVPALNFPNAFGDMQKLCEQARLDGDFSGYVIYCRPIKSRYLSGSFSKPPKLYIDLSLFMFLSLEQARHEQGREAFGRIVQALDTKCLGVNKSGANPMFRYMGTRTEVVPGSGDKRDPTSQW